MIVQLKLEDGGTENGVWQQLQQGKWTGSGSNVNSNSNCINDGSW